MATIRVRVNPADDNEHEIYADASYSQEPWITQRPGGRFTDRLGIRRARRGLARARAANS